MLYMNDYDIDCAEIRHNDPHTAKGKAVKLLREHKNIVDNNSDGWAHWAPPLHAAKRLMELIQGPKSVSETTAEECLKLALRPLKSFYTRHPQLPRPSLLDTL